jgi:hypothetical protein
VFKADAALDAANTASLGTDTGTGASTASASTGSKKSAEREKFQAKFDFATALSHLGQGNYEKAARTFLNIGPPSELGDWIGKVRQKLTQLKSQRLIIMLGRCSRGHCSLRNTMCHGNSVAFGGQVTDTRQHFVQRIHRARTVCA